MSKNDLEALGGAQGLRSIIDEFIDKVVADTMIGFFFRDVDTERVKELEYQLAARFFGLDVKYEGRPLRVAHGPHPIMGGQFMRRLKILQDVLQERGVPEALVERWLAHNEALRGQITGDAGSHCNDQAATLRVQSARSEEPSGS